MADDKDKNLTAEKLTLLDRLRAAHAEGAEARAFRDGLGMNPEDDSEKKVQGETIQAQVVSSALNAMKDAQKDLKDAATEKEKQVMAARANEDVARTNLYTTQLAEISNMRSELTATMRAIQAQNTPQAAIEGLKAFRSFMEDVAPRPIAGAPGTEKQGTSEMTTLKLEDMRQNHALSMKQIDLQIATAQNDLQLKLLQFKDDSERRWQEYKDKRDTQKETLGGIQDLLSSFRQNVQVERTAGAKPVADGQTEESPEYDVAVKSFPCQGCGQKLVIQKGMEKISCPECDITYSVYKRQ